jgi:hypothetical protein
LVWLVIGPAQTADSQTLRKETTITFSVGLVRIITVLFVIQWFDEVLITMAPINADNILLIETQGGGLLVFNHLKSLKQKS